MKLSPLFLAWFRFTAALLVLAGLACVHRVPSAGRAELPPLEPAELLARVRRATPHVQTLKGDAKLSVKSDRGSGTTSLFVAVERPTRVHVEVLDFFGRPVVQLVSDGTQFGLFDSQQGVYYRGPASAANVSRFLPVTLPPEELVSLMLGEVPLLEGKLSSADGMGLGYGLLLEQGVRRQQLVVEAGSFRVLRSTTERYQVEMPEPGRVRLTTTSSPGTELDLRYSSVTRGGPPLDAKLFRPVAPRNVRVVEVDAEGRASVPTL